MSGDRPRDPVKVCRAQKRPRRSAALPMGCTSMSPSLLVRQLTSSTSCAATTGCAPVARGSSNRLPVTYTMSTLTGPSLAVIPGSARLGRGTLERVAQQRGLLIASGLAQPPSVPYRRRLSESADNKTIWISRKYQHKNPKPKNSPLLTLNRV